MEPEQSVSAAESKKSFFTTVTPLSKYLAMALFIVMPFVGGWVGYKYTPEKIIEIEVEKNIENNISAIEDADVSKLMSAILDVHKKYSYGPGPLYVGGDKYLWFAKPHETEGCNSYSYINLDSKDETETNLSACPIVDISSTYPFHVTLCPAEQSTFSEKLCVTNLLTLEKRTIVLSDNPEITSIKECVEGNYDPVCSYDIQSWDGGIFVRQYKSLPREPFSIYTNTELFGEKTINLFDEFEIE